MAIIKDIVKTTAANRAKSAAKDALNASFPRLNDRINQMIGATQGDTSSIQKLFTLGAGIPMLQFPQENEGSGEFQSYIRFTPKTYHAAGGKTEVKKGAEIPDDRSKVSAQIREASLKEKATITMYHPHNLESTYNFGWNNEELGAAGTENMSDFFKQLAAGGLRKFSDVAGKQGTGLNLRAAAEQRLGAVINPRLAVLFQGINFREFNFVFDFMPRNEHEVIATIAIVKAFKYWSSPTFYQGNQNAFGYPSVWAIELGNYIEDQEYDGRTIMSLKDSVCTSVQVNYSPESIWTTFRNGFPVHVQLTLGFKETSVITRGDIERGNF